MFMRDEVLGRRWLRSRRWRDARRRGGGHDRARACIQRCCSSSRHTRRRASGCCGWPRALGAMVVGRWKPMILRSSHDCFGERASGLQGRASLWPAADTVNSSRVARRSAWRWTPRAMRYVAQPFKAGFDRAGRPEGCATSTQSRSLTGFLREAPQNIMPFRFGEDTGRTVRKIGAAQRRRHLVRAGGRHRVRGSATCSTGGSARRRGCSCCSSSSGWRPAS